ncbi:hypothetical protein sm9_0215 [Methanobrevibacter millerae]|uniref:Uncharacterized protein n=1 Tax=Methanobrevibacter millerae TaxID=230361 RepID=A0A0U3E1Z1_9EURY|nr:hypothetical protein sm9_0215 [Methanobrevibacter millerae]
MYPTCFRGDDAYNCSHNVDHSYSSPSLLNRNTLIKLGIISCNSLNPLPDLRFQWGKSYTTRIKHLY